MLLETHTVAGQTTSDVALGTLCGTVIKIKTAPILRRSAWAIIRTDKKDRKLIKLSII